MVDEIVELISNKTKTANVERILKGAGRHHFAFLRSYLEGLDIHSMAKRYLENAITPVISTKETLLTLQWIRKDLCSIAKRHGKFAYARIINLNPEQLKVEPVAKLPSLEDFREERDPYEMYSETELIELFNDEFSSIAAPNPKQERNYRLLKKQIEALNWLEGLVSTDPTLRDPVDAWLVPAVANRLIDAGVMTIRDLLQRINGRGHKWYAGIDQLGEVTAARILKWLLFYADKLGGSVGNQSLVKRSELNVESIINERKREFGIVPFEYFAPSPGMDGSTGDNRGVRNRSGVENDYDAIHLWLKQVKDSPNTFRSYRKEAERFLLWSLLERGKPLSSLQTDDCLAYRDFLRDLGRLDQGAWRIVYKIPQENWVGRRGTERWSSLWRPFEKPPLPRIPKSIKAKDRDKFLTLLKTKEGILSPSSQKLSHTILKSMCEYLMRQRYLDSNPFDGVKAPKKIKQRMNTGRSFTMHQWKFIQKHLETLEKTPHYFRLKFLLCFAYETGMRISEIVAATLGDIELVTIAGSSQTGRIIHVIGKGEVIREVVITDNVFSELNSYLQHRGLDSFDKASKETPLVDVLVGINFPNPKTKNKTRKINTKLSVNQLHEIVSDFFASVALSMITESISEAKHIANSSTHWLRHTCGSHAAANGTPVQIIQANLGHASLDTTTLYVTAERDIRIQAMEDHSKKMINILA
jgi:site-specific recombinase XerD